MSSLRPALAQSALARRSNGVIKRTLGDLVLELDLRLEDVGRGPGLGEGDAVLGVDVLALDVTVDGVGLGIAGSGDLERDVVGRAGLEEEGRKSGSGLAGCTLVPARVAPAVAQLVPNLPIAPKNASPKARRAHEGRGPSGDDAIVRRCPMPCAPRSSTSACTAESTRTDTS